MVARRTAIFVTTALVAVGLHSQVAIADTMEPVQDPPVVSIGDVKEVDLSAVADEVSVDWSSGYSTTTVTELTPGKLADSGDGSSTALDRTVYEVDVTVETNGTLNSIQIVSLCLLEDSSNAIINADNASVNDQSALSTRCGYAAASPTTGITADALDPNETFAATYTGTDDDTDVTDGFESYAFALEDAGSHEHGLENEGDGTSDGTVADDTNSPEDKERTVTFRFDLSHAATNSDKWYLRAVAVTQPPYTSGDEANPQWAQAISGPVTVNYFGGITSTRTDTAGTNDTAVGVAYGPLTVDASKTVEDITTGTYLANDSSNITLVGTNFDYNSGDDTLYLGQSANNSGDVQSQTGVAVVDLRCIPSSVTPTTDLATSLDDLADGAMFVDVTAKDLITGVNPSNSNTDPENATVADTHDCRLTYAGGAKYGNQEYSNTITVGIYDADGGSAGDTDADLGDGTGLTTPQP